MMINEISPSMLFDMLNHPAVPIEKRLKLIEEQIKVREWVIEKLRQKAGYYGQNNKEK